MYSAAQQPNGSPAGASAAALGNAGGRAPRRDLRVAATIGYGERSRLQVSRYAGYGSFAITLSLAGQISIGFQNRGTVTAAVIGLRGVVY